MTNTHFVFLFSALALTACSSGEKAPEFGKGESSADHASVVTQEKVVRTVEKREDIPVVRSTHMGANINKMNVQNFATLGFPGPVAQKIVKYRDDHGDFKSVDDLKNVEGMDQAGLERIKPKLAVDNG